MQTRTSKPCLRTRCSQQRYDVEDAATVPILLRIEAFAQRQHQTPSEREMCTLLGNASKKVNDTHMHRRRRLDNAGLDFRPKLRTSSTLPELGLHGPWCSHRRRCNTSLSWPKFPGSPATRTTESNSSLQPHSFLPPPARLKDCCAAAIPPNSKANA
jgi:hypothetical protein